MKYFLHFTLLLIICLATSCSSKHTKSDRTGVIDTREHPLPQPDSDVITPTSVEGNERLVNYTVQRGDTLFSISRAHGMTVQELQNINNLSGTNIQVGQSLLVRSNSARNLSRESIIHDLPVR